MKIVYICSPFRGDTVSNITNAQQPRLSSLAPSGQFTLRYSRFAVEQGVLPIAPHLLFPQFMDKVNFCEAKREGALGHDDNPDERNQAMEFNQTLLHLCQEVWVFGNSNTMGMAFAIAFAKKAGIFLKYFDENCQEIKK
ncbi:MAG: DUF4406 domain-containing protein [Eubacteriales bacterium]